jgi:hypothetical protein
MLVRAKWSVKDDSGWHNAGEVFQTEKDLGDAVERLETPAKTVPEKPEKEEPVKTEEAPKRASTRRKKA